jgi:hypothetical protein
MRCAFLEPWISLSRNSSATREYAPLGEVSGRIGAPATRLALRLAMPWLCLCLVLKGADDGPGLSASDVVNAADYSGGRVAPGEIVVLFPSNVGPAVLAGAQLDRAGRVTTSLGDTRVLFDGIAATVTPEDWPVNSAIYFQLSSRSSSASIYSNLDTIQAPRSSPHPLDKVLYSNRKKDRANAPGPQRRTTHEQRRTKTHDRCPQKSVIFDPNICHGLNGINRLSHTNTHPPKRARSV